MHCLGFEAPSAVVKKSSVFLDITPCYLPLAGFFLGFFDPEHGGDMFL
jgi:hypothetical protein